MRTKLVSVNKPIPTPPTPPTQKKNQQQQQTNHNSKTEKIVKFNLEPSVILCTSGMWIDCISKSNEILFASTVFDFRLVMILYICTGKTAYSQKLLLLCDAVTIGSRSKGLIDSNCFVSNFRHPSRSPTAFDFFFSSVGTHVIIVFEKKVKKMKKSHV